ncbi:MAG: tRNA uridine-5-carboxymethylaminomethyl(34) synthesis GTPase MnmE, partial [Rhodoferax sp.]
MSLPRHADPIAAIATAPGRGGVGIVRLSGGSLAPVIEALCGRPLRAREATYVAFRDHDGSTIDQGLAIHFPAPHSYTGEDVLELQAHGGPVVLQLLLARVLAAGAEQDPATGQLRLSGLRVAQPGEFTERAFLGGKIDLAQAEAIADLIDASTATAARSASRSLSGEFSSEIHALRDALIHLRMLVEATLDFPEEDIDFLRQADAHGQLAKLQQTLV